MSQITTEVDQMSGVCAVSNSNLEGDVELTRDVRVVARGVDTMVRGWQGHVTMSGSERGRRGRGRTEPPVVHHSHSSRVYEM
jgi:hypothetical protein